MCAGLFAKLQKILKELWKIHASLPDYYLRDVLAESMVRALTVDYIRSYRWQGMLLQTAFLDPVKPLRFTTEPMGLLRCINKTAWGV